MLCTWTQMEHGKKLGAGIDGEPEPQHLFGAAQPGAQFVQLEVWEVEMEEEALVQGLRVLASTGQPGRCSLARCRQFPLERLSSEIWSH